MPERTTVPAWGDMVLYTDAEGLEHIAFIRADVTGDHPTDMLADITVLEGLNGEPLTRQDLAAVPYRFVPEPISWR